MSATARAAGSPSGDLPGRRTPPPLRKDPVPLPLAEARRGPVAGPTPGSRRVGRTGSLQGLPATGERPGAGTEAPARPVRAHTAPVRAGTLRARTGTRPTPAPAPVPRPVADGSPAARVRSAVGAPRARLVLLVVTLLVATTLGLLFLNTAIAVNSLKATQLAAANEDRAQEVQRLERRVIAGDTPVELAEAARAAGMVPAGPAGYLVVGEDGTVTLRGEPVPAEAPEPEEEPELPAEPVTGGED
ncbi:hypothetical protein SAMN05428965_4813 [Geodermatophilus sp. DSM 45219]|nr:hypothetical protein SAMN05428965_4813 [Geodermatophilus sp. DSM 45219]